MLSLRLLTPHNPTAAGISDSPISASPPLDGAVSGTDRVIRGGSWDYGAGDCEVSYCNYGYPSYEGGIIGFRVVCP